MAQGGRGRRESRRHRTSPGRREGETRRPASPVTRESPAGGESRDAAHRGDAGAGGAGPRARGQEPRLNRASPVNRILPRSHDLLGWFQRGSVPTPAGRYRPGYRPAPVGKRGNRERGAVALPTGRAVGTDRRWSRARSVPTVRYRPGRSVPTPRPVGCHAALCDWPTAATSASRCN